MRPGIGPGLLLGAGTMAALDEIVFHQILGWHHFYDESTPAVGLASDGFLHAAELVAIVAGCFWFADLARRGVLSRRSGGAGVILGAGGFQLFDGIVNHKLLGLHQIRYDVDLFAYDATWMAILLVAGAALAATDRQRDTTTSS